MANQVLTPTQINEATWIAIAPIYQNRSTGKFHFVDDTGSLDPTEYDTLGKAIKAQIAASK